MNLLVWSRPEGGNFPFAGAVPYVGQEIPRPRQGVLLQCTCTVDERMPLSVGTTKDSGAGNTLGSVKEAPELWSPQRISGRQSREAWCLCTTWSTLSHGHCFGCWVIHLSQASFYIVLEVRNRPSTWPTFWAAQAKCQAVAVCLYC